MDKATFLEMMDQYIDGTLSSAEKYEFEQMINNDPSLRADFDLHRSIRSGIKKIARLDLKDELDSIKKEVNHEDTVVKPLMPRWLFMGAAATVITLVATVILLKNDSISYNNPNVVDVIRNDSLSANKANSMNKSTSEDEGIYSSKDKDALAYQRPSADANIADDKTVNLGNHIMKILPKEGNLGGINNEKIHVVLKLGVVNEYVLTQDYLILYADPKLFNTFKNMDPVITLNQQRNIAIEIKDNKYLFKPKNDKDE